MTRILLAAIVGTLSTASLAQAQYFQTWVSKTGSDANTCLLAAPCASFTAAFAHTYNNGQINVLDSGNYGALTITHSVTIDGGGGGVVASLMAPGNPGGTVINGGPQFTVNAGASDTVTLRNLDVFGLRLPGVTTGVLANTVGSLHVEHCTFTGFTDRGIDFRATGGYLYVRDVTIKDVGNHAVYVGNAHAMLERLTANSNGTGVIAAGSAAISVTHSVVSGNGTGFAAAYGPTAQINIDDCVMANNQWAIVAGQGGTAYVTNSSLFNNYIKALFNDGASFLVSYGTNRFAGNATDGSFTSGMAVR